VPQNKEKTAYELLNKVQPSVAEAKVFGCMAQVYIPEKLRKRKAKNKLDPRAKWAIFLGIGSNGRSWVFQFMDDHVEKESRDAYFHEGLSYGKWKKVDRGRLDDISPWSHSETVGDPFESQLHVPVETYVPAPLVTIPEGIEANESESLSFDFLAPLPSTDSTATHPCTILEDEDDTEDDDEEEEDSTERIVRSTGRKNSRSKDIRASLRSGK